MKTYKVFNPDWTCRSFQYEVGKTYKMDGEISLCERGFHSCAKVSDCFSYYSFDPKNKVALCEIGGVIFGEDGDKQVSSEITIVKEITWEEMLVLANTGIGNSGNSNSGNRNSGNRNSGNRNSGNRNSGDWNSGDCNSGDCNSGDCNSGDWNSGNCNSGDWNSGNWNSGNRNSGYFNIDTPSIIRAFGKNCKIEKWDNAEKPSFLFNVNTCLWISWDNMTDDEKANNKNAYVTEGYLKTMTYKEAWAEAFKSVTEEDIVLLKALPNFNSKIFFEITGIQIN